MWFQPCGCLAELPLLLFGLFSPPPDAALRGGSRCWADPGGAGLGSHSQGFQGGRRVRILRLPQFPRGPPRPRTLLHSVPRLQSQASCFCSLGALGAQRLSKVILQLVWRLHCAAVVLPGKVSLGARHCRDVSALPDVPGGQREDTRPAPARAFSWQSPLGAQVSRWFSHQTHASPGGPL